MLPRALLAELGLSKILLGSSGGGQFLLLLPEESRDAAETFLEAAAAEIAALSDGSLKLLWSVTENLGDWSDVRRRLTEQMEHRRGTPGFDAAPANASADAQQYFAQQLGMKLRDAESAGWSPETPGRIQIGEGKHVWSLAGPSESLAVRPPCRAQRRRTRAGVHRECSRHAPRDLRPGECCAATWTISASASAARRPSRSTSSFP